MFTCSCYYRWNSDTYGRQLRKKPSKIQDHIEAQNKTICDTKETLKRITSKCAEGGSWQHDKGEEGRREGHDALVQHKIGKSTRQFNQVNDQKRKNKERKNATT